MTLVFSGVFWAGVLILLGLLIILNIILGTRIPFFRIFLALFLVYIGISILVGHPRRIRHRWHHTEKEETVIADSSGKYDVVFGTSEINMTGVKLSDRVVSQEVNVVFGTARIRIDPETPILIQVNSAFGEAKMPDGNTTSFGEYTYRSKGLDESKPYLLIKADIAFGELEVIVVKPVQSLESGPEL